MQTGLEMWKIESRRLAICSNKAAITWQSCKQSCVSLSTAEAEYVALAGAAQEAMRWHLLRQLRKLCGGTC